MQILIREGFLFIFHCYRYRILSMPPDRCNLLNTLCYFWIHAMDYSYQFNSQRVPAKFSVLACLIFMVQIPLHMSSALDHPLERWGSVWGKGEWLLSWFKLKSMHHSNIHQLRFWFYIFKGGNLNWCASPDFFFCNIEQLVNLTLTICSLV